MNGPSAADLARLILSMELFDGFPPSMAQAVASVLEERHVAPDEVLIAPQANDDSLYLVVSGRLRVSVPGDGTDVVLADCGAGDMVGEIAFLTGHGRSATVSAIEATRVLRLPRRSYEDVERQYPTEAVEMSRILSRRLRRSQLGIALHRNRLFGALDDAVLRDVERDLELVTLHGGQTLFRQGDTGDSLYVVINGRLRVVTRVQTGEQKVLAELGQGEIVGEMAILGDQHRGATVYAIRDTNLARLSRDSFDRLSAKYPHAIAPMFTKTIVERLQYQISHPNRNRETVNTIAVVPASPDADLNLFCAQLSSSLNRQGSTLLLSGPTADALLGRPGASRAADEDSANSLIVEQLASLESAHRHVVYQADPDNPVWTKRCIRQADHVLLVATRSAKPEPGELERWVLDRMTSSSTTRASLVLLHPAGSPVPVDTKRWLAPRHIERHYHVRLGGTADFDRLARVLTGNAVGVVFGGGFARGIGHAGVVRALLEAGVPIDFVGGTSMGAIMAAQCALGWDPDQMVRVTLAVMRHYMRWDLTIPVVSFLKGHQLARVMSQAMERQDMDVEDLWLPTFCVSTNLTRSRMHVHTSGPLLKSVLASSRAPGMYPPVVLDGDLHIDGGVVNNVPADVMKDFSKGARLVSINVSPQVDSTMIADYGFGVSGWRVLWNKLSPFTHNVQVPTLPTILMRTMTFGGSRMAALAPGDLYLSPPLGMFGINEFHRAREIADVAYRFASPRIQAWQQEHLSNAAMRES